MNLSIKSESSRYTGFWSRALHESILSKSEPQKSTKTPRFHWNFLFFSFGHLSFRDFLFTAFDGHNELMKRRRVIKIKIKENDGTGTEWFKSDSVSVKEREIEWKGRGLDAPGCHQEWIWEEMRTVDREDRRFLSFTLFLDDMEWHIVCGTRRVNELCIQDTVSE